jgi:hypothetical protein
MKQIYTVLMTAAATLCAAGSMAQKALPIQPAQFTSLRPAGEVEVRGGGTPANDECTGATVQALAVGATLTINGDNTGGTDSEGIGFATTWEAISLTTCANVQISYCGTTPAFGNFALGIGDCPISTVIQPSASSDCPDGNLIINYAEVPAGTWYIPVLVEAGAEGPYTMTVTATACTLPPFGDECGTPIVLTSAATCNPVNFSTAGATQSLPPIACGGFTSPNAREVFFSFVCTNETQTIGVVGFNAADAVVELFSGTCSSLTSLGCADATFPMSATETTSEQLTQSGLTVGTTYFVRVYDYGHGSDEHLFQICVTEGAGSTIGINENTEALALTVYPNPSTGLFQVSYNGENGPAAIQVMDVTGRVVYSWYGQVSINGVHTIDLSGMTSGNYTALFSVNGARSAQRLVVK